MKKHTSWKHNKNFDFLVRQNGFGVFITSSLVLTIVTGALLGGCGIGSYHYQSSYDVSQQFENGEIASGYRYYVSGPASKPLAIVAIREDYRLQSDYWRGIDLDSASLKALVERISYVMGSEYKEDQMFYNGARIFGPDGAMVGMWYSVYDYSKVSFPEDKVISLSMALTRMPPGVRIPLD